MMKLKDIKQPQYSSLQFHDAEKAVDYRLKYMNGLRLVFEPELYPVQSLYGP
jgi:hypothetical protein